MIKNVELSDLIGELIGQPAAAMRGNVAILREAGYLSKAGRGLNSAEMNVGDAVNLLLGSMANAAGAKQKTIVNRMIDYRSLKRRGAIKGDGFGWFDGCKTFGDFLEALIANGGRLRQEAERLAGGPVDDLTTPLACSVEIELPSWAARITLSEHTSPGVWTERFRAEFTVDAGRLMEAVYQKSSGDLRVRAEVGFRTIIALHDAINFEDQNSALPPAEERQRGAALT